MTEFEENVFDVEGVTAFHAEKLPAWFTKRLDELFGAFDVGERQDFDLIVEYVQGPWLGNWGMATFNGDDVVVLEHCHVDPELYHPAHLAEMLHCGFQVAEPTELFYERTTTFLTEHRAFVPRRKAAKSAA